MSQPISMDGNLVKVLEWLRFLLPHDEYGALVSIDSVHSNLHEGNMYKADSAVVAAALDLAWKIPSGTTIKTDFIFQWAAESMAHIELYEGRTWTTGTGSKVTIFNRNRNSGNTSQVQEDTTSSFVASMGVVKDPTGQAGGTVIHDEYVWSDKKETSRSRDIWEFELKNNTTYVLKLTSDDGAKGLHEILHFYDKTEA